MNTIHHVREGKHFPKGMSGVAQRIALHLRAAGVDVPGGTPLVTWAPPSAPGGRQAIVHVTAHSSPPEEWEAALLRLPWRVTIKRLDNPRVVRFVISAYPEEG